MKFRASTSRKDQRSINSISLHPENENQILVGTVAVLSLWDLETKTKLKVFEGAHRGPITSNFFVNSTLFLSAASSAEDHSVTLWNSENELESYTFSANEPVLNAFAQGMNWFYAKRKRKINFYVEAIFK